MKRIDTDVVIVGAGSAGCVLAHRLSADPQRRVLLLEAGPPARHPAIGVPMGLGLTLFNPSLTWRYAVERPTSEVWRRGKVMGGSSAVNGMIYVRGQRADYDDWALEPWSWSHMAPAFEAVERMVQPAAAPERHPLCEAFVAAARARGVMPSDPGDAEGAGFFLRTIHQGRRMSASRAFIDPIRHRHNLTVLTGHTVERVEVRDGRAVGVACVAGLQIRARHVILCAGALETPALMMRSGIGPADVLGEAGVSVVRDSPQVGRNLHEHRYLPMQFRLAEPAHSINRQLAMPRVLHEVWRYLSRRRGVLAGGAYDAGAFFRTDASQSRADAAVLVAPYSLDKEAGPTAVESEPGCQCMVHVLRPTSTGHLRIRGPGSDTSLEVVPSYLATTEDRATAARAVGCVRRMFAAAPLAALGASEMSPGAGLMAQHDLVDAFIEKGSVGYHGCGTVAMGSDSTSPLDAEARVRGVGGLYVVDASMLPRIVSGNTNGPVMAMAWRAADLIEGHLQ